MKKLLVLAGVLLAVFVVAQPASAGLKVCPEGYNTVHRHVRAGGTDGIDLARTPQDGIGESWPGLVTIVYCEKDGVLGEADSLVLSSSSSGSRSKPKKVFHWSDGTCLIRQRAGKIGGQTRPFIPDQLRVCGYASDDGWKGIWL